MLHYFGFTIQLALLHVFYVKMKNLAFDTSKIITTLNVLNILQFCVSGLLGSTLSQKLVVTHAPAYVTFQEQQKPLATGDVSKLISHTLGVPSQSVSIQTPHESVLNHDMLLLILSYVCRMLTSMNIRAKLRINKNYLPFLQH